MTTDRLIRHYQAEHMRGSFVLYWMQQAQRIGTNPALDYAIQRAEVMHLPLVVLFVISGAVPEANLRHYTFMMQGIAEVSTQFTKLGISFYLACGEPVDIVLHLAGQAAEVVMDHGYLHNQRSWRSELQAGLTHRGISYSEVDTESMVPVKTVSDHEEYAAATIRKKLLLKLRVEQSTTWEAARIPAFGAKLTAPFPILAGSDCTPEQLQAWWPQHVAVDRCVEPVDKYIGGYAHARQWLSMFLHEKLHKYASQRNDPSLAVQSELSPYLHFGQIGAMEIVQQLLEQVGWGLEQLPAMVMKKDHANPEHAGAAAFAEELIVRRELSLNFCTYNEHYDSFQGLPAWARNTLLDHLNDQRDEHYYLDRLDQCDTNDVYWNAAQSELMTTGKMHNYMRMYWGKRMLAWSENPEDAYQILCYLNNRYALDGRDANSYAGIAWCFGKHDRPWQERNIYGMVRFMNAGGLKRKFPIHKYVISQGYEGEN